MGLVQMPVPNFMLQDLLGALRAMAVFPLLVLAPGYVVAWVLDLFEFRGRTFCFRLAFSAPLSISICPILSYLTGRFVSMTAVWAFYAATAVIFLVLLARERGWLARIRSRAPLAFAAIILVWLGVSLFSTIDLQIGDRLYFPTSAIDHSIRTAFVHSISTTGVPPANPFFQPGHAVGLRYHYFWLLMCSLAEQAAGRGVTARQAMIAGTFWAGLGLIALLAVYLRLFCTGPATRLRRRLLTGVALLGITGLDIIPALLFMFLYARGMMHFVLPSVEWWNEHVDWFVYTTLWAPHALASTIACFTAFLLLWHAAAARRYVVPAALALASAVGSSIYVAFVFAIFLAVWTVVTLYKRWYRETAVLCVAGAATVVLVLPYLRDLAGPGSGGPLFQFTVRDFTLAALVPTGTALSSTWRRVLVNGGMLPMNYLIEFGLFFLVARYKWRQYKASGQPLSRQDLAMGVMAITSTLVCTFMRSSVIGCNDLGWRGFLIAEFVLLLWAVDLFGERASLAFLAAPQKQLLAVFFAIGFAGTVTDLAIVRFYPVLADRGVVPPLDWMSPDRDFGHRTYAARAAYEWLQTATPETAAVQANPNAIFQDTLGMIYSDRPMIAADPRCLITFGGDKKECAPVIASVQAMFAGPPSLQTACASMPLDAVVAKDTDPVWSNPRSWVWTERPAFANSYVRVFRCGGLSGAGHRPARASATRPAFDKLSSHPAP
jgi:hypothetical protein